MTFDPVDRPAHYNDGRRFEVIDVLEDWASRAPDPVLGGLLWQSCKYLGRLFDKADPLEDAKKARWYLSRLISKLEAAEDTAAALEAEHTTPEGVTSGTITVDPALFMNPAAFIYKAPAVAATLSHLVQDPYDDPLR
jgi:hypothetical protein